MAEFKNFADVVHARYESFKLEELYQLNIDKDVFWEEYLRAFPAGTNEIFRERTEHDCACCRNFIKNLGTVVTIINGKICSVWDHYEQLEYPYNVVAKHMASLVRSCKVASIYRTKENSYGLEKNIELAGDKTFTWNHFHGQVSAKHHSKTPEADASPLNARAAVFARGLKEITVEALETVLGLIDANAIYRGAEFREGVASFYTLKQEYLLSAESAELFAWEHYSKPAARIRNTAMGTLLQDLSEGMTLEGAVKAFEKMVAPTNYKRSTALITPAMIKAALEQLRELGLETAIHRRHANLGDISINNVIWADSSAQAQMKDALADTLLASKKVKKQKVDFPAVNVTIEHFMEKVVPIAKSMSILMKNDMQNNLMSLTAPVDKDVGKLFKWGNNFAWSYNGNITDSNIKEKVKAAGGNTNAALRVSLAWFNGDDLDIHSNCPDGHVYFATPGGEVGRKRILDVDMNAGGPNNKVDPVENLSWAEPKDGTYNIFVNQWAKRSNDNPGFVIELENCGVVTQYSYSGGVMHGDNIGCLVFNVKGGVVCDLKVNPGLTGQGIAKEVWGIATESYVKVETLMYSPNYWDGEATGNKHWFFMLEGCKNPEPTRGIYNEYLTPELNEHRKVFEVLGAQTMCPVVPEQLSGLGFSSTRNDVVTVRVDGQDYAIQF